MATSLGPNANGCRRRIAAAPRDPACLAAASASFPAQSTGGPRNAVEMLHTRVDCELRVIGHDLQNRGWTQIRVPQHSRDPLERHRASTYLSVVKLVQRGVCSVHERQMIAQLQ